MKYGAVFPQNEIGPDAADVRAYILAVEAMGYDYLLAYDHVLGANPNRPGGWRGYTYEDQFHEVMTLFAYAAALTEKIELFTGILILPQRTTALVAKQAAEIDLLSGGRMRLGIGVGWNKVELEGNGFQFNNRGRRTDEQVDLLRLLWTQELVRFDGKYHHIDDAGINPLPIQRPDSHVVWRCCRPDAAAHGARGRGLAGQQYAAGTQRRTARNGQGLSG